MPFIDIGRSRFSIKFFPEEKGGISLLYRINGDRNIDLCTKTRQYYLAGTFDNAVALKKSFKNENFRWELSDKYVEFVSNLISDEKEYLETSSLSRKIKNIDPLSIGRETKDGYMVEDYLFKTKPWNHQKIGFLLLTRIRNMMITWDMRTGKTFAVANSLQYSLKKGIVKKAIVLCPKGIMESVWIKDVYKHTDLQGLSVKGNSLKDKISLLEKKLITIPKENGTYYTDRGNPDYYVFNHDAARSDEIVKYILNKIKPECLICDESHFLKTPSAKRTKGVLKISDYIHSINGMAICMSGTPVAKDIRDLYSQSQIVDRRMFNMSFGAYKKRYCFIVGSFNPTENRPQFEIVKGFKNLSELKDRYEPKSHRIGIEECHDMPEKIYTVENIDLSKEQRYHHDNLVDELITTINGKSIDTNAIGKFIKLVQVTGGYIYDKDGNVHYLKENPKIDALRDILSQTTNNKKRKIIVWTNYIPSIPIIRKCIEGLGLKYCEMTTQSNDRNKAEHLFQTDSSVRIMLATPGLSEGKDFSKASYAIYYDNNYKFVSRNQSEARCFTPTSLVHGRIVYIDLVANRSVDQLILESIKNKEEINRTITVSNLKKAKEPR